jgi:hypothetical protein
VEEISVEGEPAVGVVEIREEREEWVDRDPLIKKMVRSLLSPVFVRKCVF